jgi:hypothetical protein
MYNTTMLTKFRKWMNFNPPESLDMDGWTEFTAKFKKEARVRYFFTEVLGDKLAAIKYILRDAAWAIRYRTVSKFHLVDTKLKPGYHEIDERMLHANFELLVDYVEIECANMATVFDDEARKKVYGWRRKIPSILRIKEFRSRELGMKHLEWEASLVDPELGEYERSPSQAARAIQIMILYTWWKDVYPARDELEPPDSGELGLRFLSHKWKSENPEMAEKIAQWSRDSIEQEIAWDKEEEEMLIALMKIRKGLWT